MYRLICQKPVHFLSTQMALVSTFFQMFIVLGMYNFGQTKKKLFRPMVQSHFEWRILRFPCGGYSEASMFRFHYYLHKKNALKFTTKPANETSFFKRWIFFIKPAKKLQLKQFEILLLSAELTMISHGQIGISSFLDSPSNWGDMLTFLIGF